MIVLLITFTGCEGKDELIEELQISREFAPVELTSIIRNQTIVELNWTKDNDVDDYLVEVSQDVNFSSIEESLSVASNQLPVQIQLIGETLYYIRVQAISSRGLENSTYATTTANTLTEQLFLSIEPGDILATEATLRWVPNSEVTQLIVNPGNIVQDITAQEATDGIAIVTGLTGETEYTAQLLNNSNIRGV